MVFLLAQCISSAIYRQFLFSSLVCFSSHGSTENSVASDEVLKDDVVQPHQTIKSCSQSIFRSVTELSSSGERSSGLAFVEMVYFAGNFSFLLIKVVFVLT
jgi:hypothetical protein